MFGITAGDEGRVVRKSIKKTKDVPKYQPLLVRKILNTIEPRIFTEERRYVILVVGATLRKSFYVCPYTLRPKCYSIVSEAAG